MRGLLLLTILAFLTLGCGHPHHSHDLVERGPSKYEDGRAAGGSSTPASRGSMGPVLMEEALQEGNARSREIEGNRGTGG